MNIITKFFHELWNPHCEHCNIEREIFLSIERESRRCDSCESLRMQVAVLNEQNKNLINKIINPNPVQATPINEIMAKSVHRGPVPFSAIRKHLESESRAAAQALKQAALPDEINETKEITKNENINELEQLVKNATISRTAETGTKQA